jgi:small nuclear ribonucleoprotein (snRNP)-like protein
LFWLAVIGNPNESQSSLVINNTKRVLLLGKLSKNMVPKQSPRATVEKLLGCWVTCTLTDGRKAEGTLLCVDRKSNLVLADCTERRIIHSVDYNEYSGGTTESETKAPVEREATRHLRQAMVPGAHLVKVEMLQSTYEEKVGLPST